MKESRLKYFAGIIFLATILSVGCSKQDKPEQERKTWASGVAEASGSRLEFKAHTDGTSEVIGIGNETSADIVIPGTDTDGNIVTAIAPQAFYASAITSVTFPDTLVKIGEAAFDGCSNLKSLDIPGSVTTLNTRCFANCFNVSEIRLHEGLQTIGEAAFQCSNALTEVEIPEGVINIADFAFSFSGLKEIKLPESVFFIGSESFSHCSDLKRAEIPSAGTIGDNVFYNCKKLTEVILPDKLPARVGEHLFLACDSLGKINGMDAQKYQAIMQRPDLI